MSLNHTCLNDILSGRMATLYFYYGLLIKLVAVFFLTIRPFTYFCLLSVFLWDYWLVFYRKIEIFFLEKKQQAFKNFWKIKFEKNGCNWLVRVHECNFMKIFIKIFIFLSIGVLIIIDFNFGTCLLTIFSEGEVCIFSFLL